MNLRWIVLWWVKSRWNLTPALTCFLDVDENVIAGSWEVRFPVPMAVVLSACVVENVGVGMTVQQLSREEDRPLGFLSYLNPCHTLT